LKPKVTKVKQIKTPQWTVYPWPAELFPQHPSCAYHKLVSRSFLPPAQANRKGCGRLSARAFVHRLDIVIKYARMYGYDHKRTEAQFETTWNEPAERACPAAVF
jgi:hypothetical protein